MPPGRTNWRAYWGVTVQRVDDPPLWPSPELALSSEALVVTGIGLAVAIPAVLAYNMLVSQSEKIELNLSTAAGELTDHLENVHGSEAHPAKDPRVG